MYPSELTDKKWMRLEPLLNEARAGRQLEADRESMNSAGWWARCCMRSRQATNGGIYRATLLPERRFMSIIAHGGTAVCGSGSARRCATRTPGGESKCHASVAIMN